MVNLSSVRLRAPRPDEARAVFAVLSARDTVDFGAPDCTLDDVLDEWRASDFDLEADARVCEDERGAIVAYTSVRPPCTYGSVAPEHEGRGAGKLLLAWAERRQLEAGWNKHRQAIAGSNARARTLLEGTGYVYVRSHWRMSRVLDGSVERPAVPEGVSMRMLDTDADAEVVYELDRTAFADVAEAQLETLSEFVERHLQTHDLDTTLSTVALRGSRVVGFLLARRWPQESVGYVGILAVAPPEQRQGIGRTLLLRAFAAFQAAGLEGAELSVAADNPKALHLYKAVGMRARFQIDVYERALTAAVPPAHP
jgi:mycothiol synthase